MIWLPPERYVILFVRLEEDGKVLTPEEVLYKVGYYTADMCLWICYTSSDLRDPSINT